jgi:hypothetical protein
MAPQRPNWTAEPERWLAPFLARLGHKTRQRMAWGGLSMTPRRYGQRTEWLLRWDRWGGRRGRHCSLAAGLEIGGRSGLRTALSRWPQTGASLPSK